MSRTKLMGSAAPMTSLRRPAGKTSRNVADETIVAAAAALVANQATNQAPATPEPPAAAAPAAPPSAARAAENDDDDDEDDEDRTEEQEEDEEDDDNSRASAAPVSTPRRRVNSKQRREGAAGERAKIKAILESPAGAAAFKANPDKVIRFLTTFSGTKEDAIATLELLGPTESPASSPRSENLRERIGASNIPNAGPGIVAGNSNVAQQLTPAAEMILRADAIRRGEKQ